MTQQQYLIKRKLTMLELAQTLGSVSEACRKLNVSRQHFYDVKKALEEEGIEGLVEKARYQSVVPDSTINSIAEGVNQIDAILYTNFVGGGNIGTSGGGVTINGTIISRDEAMVTWSLPIIMNYDNRIRERSVDEKPLVDLNLPRSPAMMRSTWQDRGFQYRSYSY